MSEESKKEVIIENESNEIVDSTNLGSRVDDTFSKMGEIVEGAVNSEEKIQTTPELTELGNPIGTLNLEDETTKTELENIVVVEPETITETVLTDVVVTEQTLLDNPELISEVKPGDTIQINLETCFVPGENLLEEKHFIDMPELTEEGFVVGDILMFEEGKPTWKKEVTPRIVLSDDETLMVRIKELIAHENNFNYLAIGKYLVWENDVDLEKLEKFHIAYKAMGALSTPAHYELIEKLDKLFGLTE